MKKIKHVFAMITYNLWTFIGFEVLFKWLSMILFTPLFLKVFHVIMHITGFRYLTFENIFSFLGNPITILMLLILVLLITVYTMFDITTILIILDCSYQKKKINMIDAIGLSLRKCKKILHVKNLPLAFLVLFLIPFLNIGVASSYITTLKIPEFILDFIFKNQTFFFMFFILLFILTLVLLKWIYALHYFVLEGVSFKEAIKRSKSLSKKHRMKDLMTLIVVQFTIFLLYIAFVIVGILLIVLLAKLIGHILVLKSITATFIFLFFIFSIFVIAALATPISYATISALYYFHKWQKKEKIKLLTIESSPEKQLTFKWKKMIICLSLLLLLGGTIFTSGLYRGKYHFAINHSKAIEVTAHRGASTEYPENTMLAFQKAKEQGAEWIELDVQQTKDGQIIVFHDMNLKRVTGIDRYTWEVTYEEIKDLDAGSFLNKTYREERIPLLQEVVKWAKDHHMKLNIELKPNDYDQDLEKKVIDIIINFGDVHNCVITSQIYSVLNRVKHYRQDIKTAYVMSLAYGDILSFHDADYFSIEATSITPALVSRIHKQGKQIYAWTVNTEENIRRMIDMDVDNIITDQVPLTKQIIYVSKTSNFIYEYMKLIESLF